MSLLINYSFRNLLARKVTTILTAGGMALVTFVFTAVLMLAEGLEYTLTETGSPDNAVVLRKAAESEVASIISRDEAAIVEVQPETARDPRGDVYASKESVVLVTLPKKDSGKPTNVVVRGTDRHSMQLRPQVKLIQGRIFRPGAQEIIAGRSIAERIENVSLGGRLRFALTNWRVVGIFDAGPTAFNSEVWGDADQLMSVFRRNSYSVVIARIPKESLFDVFKARLEGDPRLTVQVKREIVFYREQSEVMAKFIRILGLAMTIFFSVGAALGAMVTMYTAVANRTGEIGTLRALGFSRAAVMGAFLGESLLLGLTGGMAGLAGGSLLQLLTISTLNWETFSELAFGFRLTPSIVLYSLVFAGFMGVVGGLLPALRAARLEIVDSLRA